MTHAERMAKINADADAELAKIMEERAEIERVGRENERRYAQARAAMDANNLDEMVRLMNEAREQLLRLRHH